MVLKFRVYEQTISLQSTKAEPRQGSKDYLELQFSFSSDWNALLKYVYIQLGEVSVPHELVDGSVIVDEYFTEQAEFNVTLFGRSVDGSVEVPTNVITVSLKESNTLWEKDAPEPQNSWFVQVVDARDQALAAAIRAENAAIHQPYTNTDTWRCTPPKRCTLPQRPIPPTFLTNLSTTPTSRVWKSLSLLPAIPFPWGRRKLRCWGR